MKNVPKKIRQERHRNSTWPFAFAHAVHFLDWAELGKQCWRAHFVEKFMATATQPTAGSAVRDQKKNPKKKLISNFFVPCVFGRTGTATLTSSSGSASVEVTILDCGGQVGRCTCCDW